jgi:hypothetical protein
MHPMKGTLDEAGLEVYKDLDSGMGKLWYFRNSEQKAIFREVLLRKMRVRPTATPPFSTTVFIENRSLSGVREHGCGAAAVVKGTGSNVYQLGICVACTLYSMSYLEWKGAKDTFEALYTKKKTGAAYWNAVRGSLELKTVEL